MAMLTIIATSAAYSMSEAPRHLFFRCEVPPRTDSTTAAPQRTLLTGPSASRDAGARLTNELFLEPL